MTPKTTPTPPSSLPPLYATWMDELLAGPVPAETAAPCHDCAMLAPAGKPAPAGMFFRPTIQVLRRIEQNARITVERDLVRRLVDAGLLVRRE